MRTTRMAARAVRAGFTLIEILAVIVILSILLIVLLPRLSEMGRHAEVKVTATRLVQIAAAIGDYENRFGDYPPSQFLDKWGSAPNLTNMGGEALVISLWSTDWSGANLPEDWIDNSDGDEAKQQLTRFGSKQLYELRDGWNNPIAYFHRRDYGRTDTYIIMPDEAGDTESQVKALLNPKTKTYYEPNKFQLISAGLDGRFGTEDDITSFKQD